MWPAAMDAGMENEVGVVGCRNSTVAKIAYKLGRFLLGKETFEFIF